MDGEGGCTSEAAQGRREVRPLDTQIAVWKDSAKIVERPGLEGGEGEEGPAGKAVSRYTIVRGS